MQATLVARSELVRHQIAGGAEVLQRGIVAQARHAAHVYISIRRHLNSEAALLAGLFQERPPIGMKRRVDRLHHGAMLALDGPQLLPDRGDRALDARSFERQSSVGRALGVAAKAGLIK